MIEISDDIDADIDAYLDMYNAPYTTNPKYKALIELKIKDLLKQKYNIIRNSLEDKDFESYQSLCREFNIGKTVELEHTSDRLEAAKIALDHLKEDPQYYSKLKAIHKDSFNPFDLYDLAVFIENNNFGLYEPIKIEGIDAELVSLIDTGNEAYNVLHGTDIKEEGNLVYFKTFKNIPVQREKVDEIIIHVGAGHDEHRPVVEFTIEINKTVYPDVRFSIGDRSKNRHPVLIGADFLKQINALVDVNKH